MATAKEERITIIPFDGSTKQWKIWSMKFLAQARRKGYKDILTGKETVPNDNAPTPLSDADDKLRKLNELAYEDIILSMDGSKTTGRVALRLVETATMDMADGNAREAWKKLTDKYQPDRAPN